MGPQNKPEGPKSFRAMKACSSCQELKYYTEFNKQKRTKDGLQSSCRSCQAKYNRSERSRGVRRVYKLRYRYGLTPEKYQELLDAQGGVCKICKRIDWSGKTLDVDHDHSCCPGEISCGKCIRGLLCRRCNTIIGQVEESASVLKSMIDYLEE